MKCEFSAGGVVFNDKGQVLVTQHSKNHHWSFPKGLLDHPGQTMEESALREVREEGGVNAEIIRRVGANKYVYTLRRGKIFKVGTYFLMKYKSGDTADHDWEVSDLGWYTPEEALKKLTFPKDRELLKKALKIL